MAAEPDDLHEWESRSFPVREDITFQRRYWVVQRIAWIGLAALAVAMILGLFSNGVFSRITADAESGAFAVEYQRFYRLGAAAGLTLRLNSGDAREFTVHFDKALLQSFTLETIRPTPLRSETDARGLVLTFRTAGGGGNVHFAIRPTQAGPARGAVSLGAGDAVPLKTFVYP